MIGPDGKDLGSQGIQSSLWVRFLRHNAVIAFMETKIPLVWVVSIISGLLLAFSLMIILIVVFTRPTYVPLAEAVPIDEQVLQDVIKSKSLESAGPRSQASFGLPSRLTIPKIGVDTMIESVGLTPGGAMGVPTEAQNAAWFNLGPHPGQNGNAVIDGHLNWTHGTAAVFDNLYKLRPGDKLSVEDEEGRTTTFVVREFRIYDQNQDASDVFGLGDGQAHLNLITCEGLWNKVERSYPNRLVVFTDREMEE